MAVPLPDPTASTGRIAAPRAPRETAPPRSCVPTDPHQMMSHPYANNALNAISECASRGYRLVT